MSKWRKNDDMPYHIGIRYSEKFASALARARATLRAESDHEAISLALDAVEWLSVNALDLDGRLTYICPRTGERKPLNFRKKPD